VDAVIGRTHKKAAALGIVIMLFGVACFVPLDGDDTVIESDSSEAIAPLVALMWFFLVSSGVGTGYIIGTSLFGNDPAGSNNDAVLRASAADNITAQIGNALKHDLAYAQDEPQLVGFTESYFERMGELAAAELYAAGTTLNRDDILLTSTALGEYAKFMLNRMNIVNSIFEPFKTKATSWSSSSTYNSMKISFGYGSNQVVSDGTTLVKYGLGTTVTSASQSQAYLYNGDGLQDGYLYATGNATIKNVESGQTHTLTGGYNSLAGVPTGIYDLQEGVTYIGSIMQTYSDRSVTVVPAAALQAGSKLVYVLSNDSGYVAVTAGTAQSISALNYKIAYDGTSQTIDLLDGLKYISVLYNASKTVFAKTLNAATAAWYIFNAAGESSILVSPSALLPNLENMDFTPEQIYLIFMSVLPQASEYFKTASGNFSADDVLISEDSLDLICYGSIYTNASKSTAVATDVYFTPMCFLRDQAVLVGDTAWLQSGIVMLWEKQEDGSFKASGVRTLESGNHFVISELQYRGVKYTTLGEGVTLKVKALTRVDGYHPRGTTDPELSKSISLYIIMIVIGIVIAFGGYVADVRFFTALGAIIFLAGVVLIISTLDWTDFLPFAVGG
jgi:hypothetical protein